MCPHTGKVLKDPIMISLTFFTLIFIITISLACAQPWKVPSGLHRGRSVRDIQPPVSSSCLFTYQAFQPNMDFFKEKLAEITVDKCSQSKAGTKKNKRRQRNKKNKPKKKKKNKRKRKPKKSKKVKKPKNRSKTRKLPDRKRKRKKISRELRTFRRWKSLMSARAREPLADPAAQRAVTSLWSDLLEAGPHWRNILGDLQDLQHENTSLALPSHTHHSLRS